MGAKRLSEYDCKIGFKKDYIINPRQIRKPDDVRPGTKKGKLDRMPVWVVEIQMPKKLIADIYTSYADTNDFNAEPATDVNAVEQAPQQADVTAAPPAMPPLAAPGAPAAAPAGEDVI
jgi:hypothetical protein